MFGGATGDTGKYVITADTYTLDLTKSIWKKIDGKIDQLIILGGGIAPSPRAAHSATSIDSL